MCPEASVCVNLGIFLGRPFTLEYNIVPLNSELTELINFEFIL